MLCDHCLKNTATVHMTTFVNGQVKTVHLCAQCAAKKKKPAAVSGLSFNDFMSAFYDAQDAETTVCANCGTTLAEFQKTGRLGCANCYQVFESAIMPILKGVHMNVKHTGKRPGQRVNIDTKKAVGRAAAQNKKEALQRELKIAVSTENYEEAAKLRDEIALLEKEGE